MKTLDEVIEELQYWDEGLFTDALHYLREYRKFRKALNLKVMGNEPLLERLIDVLREVRGEK